MRTSTPRDLARTVHRTQSGRVAGSPGLETLTTIIGVMFSASLQREERQPILFHVVYLDPMNPDPDPPPRVRENRWVYVPFAAPQQFTAANMVKLAKATDPRTSSLVVYPDKDGELRAWGLVDQGTGYFDMLNYEGPGGWSPPGRFQVSILGIGHIEVQAAHQRLGELKGVELAGRAIDALHTGPLLSALMPGISRSTAQVRREANRRLAFYDADNDQEVIDYWLGSLCRLLLRVRTYGHGGAILITSSAARSKVPTGLNVKYGLDYGRLATSVVSRTSAAWANSVFYSQIVDRLDAREETLPSDFYVNQAVTDGDREDAEESVDGALWFISLLTRVDGLVLMTPTLAVKGFGVEITIDQAPARTELALDAAAKRTRMLAYNHFGTRHRSMMRFCYARAGSIGFVVSQDGDVRAMTRVGATLLVWENIELHQRLG